jgi:hypothetical protein
MKRGVTVALAAFIFLIPSACWAWGPHSEIGMAGLKVLDKSDPFLTWINNETGRVASLSWWNDMAGGAAAVGVCDIRVYTRDCLDIPGFNPTSDYANHGDPASGTYEAFFGRLLQAMHTETPTASMGWLGAVLHDTEDTGAPPHAGKAFSSSQHGPMEGWVDGSKVNIAGYEPKLLGKTEEEAIKGYAKRLNDLHDYSLERAKKIFPLAQAKDRPAAEPMILECANESARAVADVLHTLGYLQAQIKPIPGAGGLSGTIMAPADPERLTARIMLQETKFSTLADLKGHYEFRNLPPGKYTAIVMMPRCKPQNVEVAVEADKQTTKDVTLEANGNLLRNGGLSVRWLHEDQPDGWYGGPIKGAGNQWTSEPFFVKPGQSIHVSMSWKDGAQAQAGIVWEGKDWDDKTASKPGDSSLVVTVPADTKKTQVRNARVFVRCKDPLAKAADSISVKVESETGPSGK